MKTARVLIVDDESNIRVLLDEILSEEGYQVTTAADAGEARAARDSNDFDLILQTELKQWTGKGDESGRIGFGFIAEEIEEMGLANLVLYDNQGRVQSLLFRNIPLYTLEVVKRHESDINGLRSEFEELCAEKDAQIQELLDANTQFRTELSELRAQVAAFASLGQRMAEMEARLSAQASNPESRN